MTISRTLEEAATLLAFHQRLMAAETPEELLRVFVEPIWGAGRCNAVLAFIDRRSDRIEDWTAETLASIVTEDQTVIPTPVGGLYRISDYPFFDAFLSNRDLVQVYDLDTPDHPFNDVLLKQQNVHGMGIVLLKKPDSTLVGGVALRWNEQRDLSEAERQLLTALIPGMAMMVDHLSTLAQHERTLQLMEPLYTANRQLLTAEGYEQILNAVYGYASKTDANVASLVSLEVDENGQPEWATIIARAGAIVGVGSPLGTRFFLPDIPFTKVWIDEADDILLVEDSSDDPRYDDISRELALRVGVRATVTMPLKIRGRWIGLISINWEEPHHFSATERQFYRALSTQIAAVLETQRLRNAELQTLQKLAEQEAHYRLLAENATDMISVNAPDGTFTYVSPSSSSLLGYTAEEMIGISPYSLIHPDDTANVREGHVALLETPEDFRRQFRMRRSNDEYVWVETTSKAVRNPDGTVRELVSATRDISSRKAAEDAASQFNLELARKAAQLEATNQELEAFTYSVSHDLRAPLRAIDGFSRILTETFRDRIPEEAVRNLDRVRANAQKMGTLIDDLLDLSRVSKRSLERRQCDMHKMAQMAFQEVSEGEQSDSVKFILSDLPDCPGDPGLINQLFVNLISNAIKFSRGCAEPTVEVGVEDKAQGFTVYFVRDNGIGFDMDYANKIFGVFQRLHNSSQYEGTGVGLAIVQRIVNRHGGRIWVDSAPNAGTTFFFTLMGEPNAR